MAMGKLGARGGFGRSGAVLGKAGVLPIPRQISGMAFWHDPSVASSVTLNSGDVSSINDLSGGNLRPASNATTAEQPAYTTPAINGLNAITYTGASNDALNLVSATDIVQNVAGFTFFAICNLASLAVANRVFSVMNNAGVNRYSPNFVVTSGRISLTSRRLDSDSSVTSAAAALALSAGVSAFCLWRCHYANGSVKVQIGAVSETLSPVWTGGNGTTSNTASSAAPSYARNGASIYTGIIGEAGGYARAISDAEIETLRAYCAAKWGTS